MQTFPLIDVGLDLASHRFTGDWKQVVARAYDSGVEHFILTGATLKIYDAALLTEKMAPGTGYFTAGIHAHYASELGADALVRLRALLAHPHAVEVGETGLDYNRDMSPRPVQRAAIEAQVELACSTGKPLFLHEREAADDLLAIHDNVNGREAVARRYVERGSYLRIAGWVGHHNRSKCVFRDAIPANWSKPALPMVSLAAAGRVGAGAWTVCTGSAACRDEIDWVAMPELQ
ncbi:TatD family hydrolase [Massilia mucilaginosa]|nr:TatD family hydrolase [Massilia mucilaginosa]